MKRFLFLGMTMLMFVFTACNKESEQNIIGSWKLVLIQESYEGNYGENENNSYAVEEDTYYIFQKDGVLSYCGEGGTYGSDKWVYADGKIVIADGTYNIENFSHKEMDLAYIDYHEYYDEYDNQTYWFCYTYRMHFKREKAPKEYCEK